MLYEMPWEQGLFKEFMPLSPKPGPYWPTNSVVFLVIEKFLLFCGNPHPASKMCICAPRVNEVEAAWASRDGPRLGGAWRH